MRKTLIIFVLIAASVLEVSGNFRSDSLLKSRSSVYYQYLDIKNNTVDLKISNYIKLTDILEQLVLLDNRIIDSLDAKNKQVAGLTAKLSEKEIELESLRNEKTTRKILEWIIILAGGFSFVLMIAFGIMLLMKIAQANKIFRKLPAAGEEGIKKKGKLKDVISNFVDLSAEKDQKIETANQALTDIRLVLEEKEKLLEEYKNRSMYGEEHYKRLAEMELNMAKLKNMGELKTSGVISQDEFQDLKQKYLGTMLA